MFHYIHNRQRPTDTVTCQFTILPSTSSSCHKIYTTSLCIVQNTISLKTDTLQIKIYNNRKKYIKRITSRALQSTRIWKRMIDYMLQNIALLSLYFLRLLFGGHLYPVLQSVLMYHQHTLLFCFVLDVVHHLHKKWKSRTEPWGTPYLTGRLHDKYSFSWSFAMFVTLTCCVLFLK
jgi:hypothetical protein